ncbi:putative ATP-dependent RNA helicase DDX20 [Myripristis murdjan]|uniref:RNA helicase n=1 Tax=Myripristis murdjan TaxID=586833 RepID=A0A667Z2H7_9TELE|nr:probable ATP-dependent RNA helicase DDX20 [Myripristis murdjan]
MATSMRKAAHDIETRKRTDDVLLSEGIDFGSLLLSPAVLQGLAAAGFQKPSPIQLKAIPLGRCGLDLIVQAKSGTGKTCVFCTIALDSLVLENHTTQVLVLAPTREIAVQIHSVVMAIGSAMEGLECHVFIGGRPVSQDKPHLKKCHIAVGSPGRIKQLIELGMLSTASIRLFVLDEADKLLEEGSFQEQINWIFSSLPVNKQMLALSATYPESLAQHLARYMREPTFVRLNPNDPGLKGLKQYYKLVQSHALPHKIFEEKVLHLLELFSKIPFNQALVFSNLHTRAQHLADILSSKGLPAVCISGGLSQDQRLEAMSKLKQYQCRVLISTDLTSRGIDAEKVNLVINLDVPQDWETYMHRIGRAGRFGTQGLAVTYCCHGEEENKMMAIAQKCNLNLTALPSPIEPGLMEETCDWDVSVEAAAPDTIPKLFSGTEKKRLAKTEATSSRGQEPSSASLKDSGPNKPERRHAAPQPRVKGERNPQKVSPTKDTLSTTPRAPANPDTSLPLTRKEQQEALPKIPPLSCFKNHGSRILTFEEAESDFHSFITKGLGRSVEVIRQFRGQGDEDGVSDQHGYREVLTLGDDRPHTLTRMQNRERQDTNLSHPRSSSGSSSSYSDKEDSQQDDETLGGLQTRGGKNRAVTVTQPAQSEARHESSMAKPRLAPSKTKARIPSVPEMCHETTCAPKGRAFSQPQNNGFSPDINDSWQTNWRVPAATGRDEWSEMNGEVWKQSKNVSDMSREPKAKRDEMIDEEEEQEEDEEEEEEDERSTESYWGSYYRAWDNYYASMLPPQQHGYHSYYSLAHNWMAAYRMNAVYIQELLKH